MLAPYCEKFIYAISQETYEKNLIDKLPKLSIDYVKKTINKMSDVENLTLEMKSKKDDLLNRRELSKHAGLPPTKGEKWMCNKWIRLNKFLK